MADFGSLEDVESELHRLAAGDDPLVGCLSRRPGQKEERWAETLSTATSEPSITTEITRGSDRDQQSPVSDEVAVLRADLDTLQLEVNRIAAAVAELRTALGL
jgi:uncharacterized protein YceH (UPF0502 family)